MDIIIRKVISCWDLKDIVAQNKFLILFGQNIFFCFTNDLRAGRIDATPKNLDAYKKGISNHTCIVACTITRTRSINMTSEEKTETKEKKQIRRDNKGNIIEEKYETEYLQLFMFI